MMGMIPAYATLFAAAAAAAAAASSNGTMFASAPDTWNDPCALGCLAASTCPGRDKNCLCDNFDLVTSDASRGCIRNGCPNVKADDVVGQLRGECSGRKMTTVKGSPVMSLQASSTSSAAAGSSPTVNGVDPVGGSSLAVPSSPSWSSPSAAEGSISTSASASSPVPPTVVASPGTWTGVPTVIANTYPLSPLPSQPSELVVATSTPQTSTASTTGGGMVGGGSGSNSDSNTSPSSPRGTPNTTSPTSDQETNSPDSELSAGAKAGIGISIAVACLGIISAVFYFGWRRRQDERNSGLGEDTVSWLRHAGEKHRTMQAIPAFGPTRKIGGGVGDAGGGDGSGVGGLAMSLEPSSHLTYLSLGSEPSPGDDMDGIGMALSSDIYDALDSRTLVAEGDSETPLRDGELDSPVIPRFVLPHGDSPA